MKGFLVAPEKLYEFGVGRPSAFVLDVRAPVEYHRGGLPYSINEPLLTDEERHQVGLCYKREGQQAAIALGYKLVESDLERRVAGWREVCMSQPTLVMCWRGGLRSKLVCDFVGLPQVGRLKGGYKALRAHLLAGLEEISQNTPVLVVAGLTGVGKTSLLQEVGHACQGLKALDLEALAHHRGSAFGSLEPSQPNQATFENFLAAELILAGKPLMLVEDESRHIGSLQLPAALYAKIQKSPVVLVEEPLETRLGHIYREYIEAPSKARGILFAREELEQGLKRLHKRLGGARLSHLLDTLQRVEKEGVWYSAEAHARWIAPLLEGYYDPLYQRALENLARPTVFRGTREECLAWILKTYP